MKSGNQWNRTEKINKAKNGFFEEIIKTELPCKTHQEKKRKYKLWLSGVKKEHHYR